MAYSTVNGKLQKQSKLNKQLREQGDIIKRVRKTLLDHGGFYFEVKVYDLLGKQIAWDGVGTSQPQADSTAIDLYKKFISENGAMFQTLKKFGDSKVTDILETCVGVYTSYATAQMTNPLEVDKKSNEKILSFTVLAAQYLTQRAYPNSNYLLVELVAYPTYLSETPFNFAVKSYSINHGDASIVAG